MAHDSLVCLGWVDLQPCNTALPYPPNEPSGCNDVITGDRLGYCNCLGGRIKLSQDCGHPPIKCDTLCRPGGWMGCKDPYTQLAVIYKTASIVGCEFHRSGSLSWDSSHAGLDYAEQALCDIDRGFHICSTAQELQQLGLTPESCTQQGTPNSIYLTKVGMTREHLYGCGNVENHSELPVVSFNVNSTSTIPLALRMDTSKMQEKQYRNGPWKLAVSVPHPNDNDESDWIANRVYKPKVFGNGGGIMCCKGKDLPPNEYDPINEDNTYKHGWWYHVFTVIFGIILPLMFAFIGTLLVIKIVQYLFIAAARRFACVRRIQNWNGIVRIGGRLFPLTRRGRMSIQHLREIQSLECRLFQDFQDPINQEFSEDVITDTSGSCPICWEPYGPKTKVLRLNCGHHFHHQCILQWLMAHRDCPICRQDFHYGINRRHSRRIAMQFGINAYEIEMDGIMGIADIDLDLGPQIDMQPEESQEEQQEDLPPQDHEMQPQREVIIDILQEEALEEEEEKEEADEDLEEEEQDDGEEMEIVST